MNLNQATIAGNLTRRPELKSIPSGAKVASFSVATNEHYTDANGNKQQKTTFHNVKVWGPQAENCAKYLVKGQSVLVAGKIENSSYKGNDDVTKYRSEIIARAVQFGPKPKGYEENQIPEARTMVKIPPTPPTKTLLNSVKRAIIKTAQRVRSQ